MATGTGRPSCDEDDMPVLISESGSEAGDDEDHMPTLRSESSSEAGDDGGGPRLLLQGRSQQPNGFVARSSAAPAALDEEISDEDGEDEEESSEPGADDEYDSDGYGTDDQEYDGEVGDEDEVYEDYSIQGDLSRLGRFMFSELSGLTQRMPEGFNPADLRGALSAGLTPGGPTAASLGPEEPLFVNRRQQQAQQRHRHHHRAAGHIHHELPGGLHMHMQVLPPTALPPGQFGSLAEHIEGILPGVAAVGGSSGQGTSVRVARASAAMSAAQAAAGASGSAPFFRDAIVIGVDMNGNVVNSSNSAELRAAVLDQVMASRNARAQSAAQPGAQTPSQSSRRTRQARQPQSHQQQHQQQQHEDREAAGGPNAGEGQSPRHFDRVQGFAVSYPRANHPELLQQLPQQQQHDQAARSAGPGLAASGSSTVPGAAAPEAAAGSSSSLPADTPPATATAAPPAIATPTPASTATAAATPRRSPRSFNPFTNGDVQLSDDDNVDPDDFVLELLRNTTEVPSAAAPSGVATAAAGSSGRPARGRRGIRVGRSSNWMPLGLGLRPGFLNGGRSRNPGGRMRGHAGSSSGAAGSSEQAAPAALRVRTSDGGGPSGSGAGAAVAAPAAAGGAAAGAGGSQQADDAVGGEASPTRGRRGKRQRVEQEPDETPQQQAAEPEHPYTTDESDDPSDDAGSEHYMPPLVSDAGSSGDDGPLPALLSSEDTSEEEDMLPGGHVTAPWGRSRSNGFIATHTHLRRSRIAPGLIKVLKDDVFVREQLIRGLPGVNVDAHCIQAVLKFLRQS